MTSRYTSTVVIFLLFIAFSAALRSSQIQPGTSAESAEVKRAALSFIEPFNRHDSHGVAMTYTEDGDFTSARGASAHGRKKIEEFYAGVFAGRLKNAHRTAVVKNIRFLAPDIASVDADWEITGATADDGSNIPLRKGILNVILAERNGNWLTEVFHELELTVSN